MPSFPEGDANVEVSVAMATFNGMSFLPEQIDSILAQSRPVNEIVICDDCSTDGTWEYLLQIAESVSQIRLLRNDENLGSTATFSRALSECSGKIVFLCDQDDIWHLNKVKVMVHEMVSRGALLLMSDGCLIDGAGRALKGSLWEVNALDEATKLTLQSPLAVDLLATRSYVTGCASCLSHEVLSVALPIPRESWHDAWLALFAACLSVNGIALMPAVLISYRQHSGNQIGARLQNLGASAVVHNGGSVTYQVVRYLKLALKELHDASDIGRDLKAVESIIATLDRVNLPRAEESKERLKERWQYLFARIQFVSRQRSVFSIVQESSRREYSKFGNGVPTMIRDVLLRLFANKSA